MYGKPGKCRHPGHWLPLTRAKNSWQKSSQNQPKIQGKIRLNGYCNLFVVLVIVFFPGMMFEYTYLFYIWNVCKTRLFIPYWRPSLSLTHSLAPSLNHFLHHSITSFLTHSLPPPLIYFLLHSITSFLLNHFLPTSSRPITLAVWWRYCLNGIYGPFQPF